MLVDVHAHLEFENYDEDRDEVIEKNKEAGVVAIVCNGTSPKGNRKVLEISEKYDIIKAAFGFYPIECETAADGEVDEEIDFIRENKNKIIAIGEVGLDKKHDENFEKQKECFVKFIELSKELNKPIIVHSRQAEIETIELLEKHGAKKVVMHCFSGKRRLIEMIIKNGWCVSIPANVGRNQQFQGMVDMCPLKQLLTETDSPFLVHDATIERNEPRFIAESLKVIAEIKGLEVEEMEKIIYSNYQRLFF
ncbi:MAG: TatD family hydrolase [archaeon]